MYIDHEPELTADGDEFAELDSLSKTNGTCSPVVTTDQADFRPVRQRRTARDFTTVEVNELLILPDGKVPNGDFDDLQSELQSDLPIILGMDAIPLVVIDELVALRGVEYCQWWAEWLPRLVASYYAKGEPVISPSGMYVRAVRGEWKVNPSWPAFDEFAHSGAARARTIERRERYAKKVATVPSPIAPSPTTYYDDDDDPEIPF